MSEYVIIIWTAANIEEARNISRKLVEERHVACASLIPTVESIYEWEGRIETSQESKVLFKTRREKFAAVEQVIRENCSYDVPEITAISLETGHQPYFDWIDAVTG